MHEMNCYYREKWYIEARYKNLKKGIFFPSKSTRVSEIFILKNFTMSRWILRKIEINHGPT